MTLVTSIPPKRPLPNADERHRNIALSIRSFETNGFDVVSVNRPAEIERLGGSFPSVAFVGSDRFEGMFEGRYGPSLGAVFEACRRAGGVCGIVNADVYMIDGGVAGVLGEEPRTFHVARRVDVEHYGGAVVGVYRRGIDAVFFDPSQFSALLDDDMLADFQLGAPFWDIVTPVLASFHGEVSFIDPPFILHAVHAANWEEADYALLRSTAVTTAVAHARRHAATRPKAAQFLQVIEKHVGEIDQLSDSRRHSRRAADVLNAWLLDLEKRRRRKIVASLGDPVFHASLQRFAGDADLGESIPESIPESPRKRRDPLSLGLRRMRRWRDQRNFRKLMDELEQ